MSWTRSIALVAVVCLIAGSSLAFAAGKQDAKRAARVERGAYLVHIMGCGDCHTPGTFYGSPDMERMLSGSEMGWQGPTGIVFAANLTPDMANGLGEWSDEEIIKAIRTGNRPDGRQLAPIMPWMDFSVLTDEDAAAIVAYLRSLKAVAHAVPNPVPLGQKYDGPVLAFPPPSAWDAPRTGEANH